MAKKKSMSPEMQANMDRVMSGMKPSCNPAPVGKSKGKGKGKKKGN